MEQFFSAVRAAEKRGASYGVRIHPEPENPHDPNAVAVYGYAVTKRWFRAPADREWHVGYIPADVASELQRDLISKDIPIEAELYSLYRKDDYHEIRFFVLAPSGFGVKVRLAAAAPEGSFENLVGTIKRLKREKRRRDCFSTSAIRKRASLQRTAKA